MIKLRNRRAELIALFVTVLLLSGVTFAKLIPVTLAGLVEEASVIAYGTPVAVPSGRSPQLSSRVRFQPLSVLKGKSLMTGKDIAVCNDLDDSESYDLRQFSEPYILFAMEENGCYKPVHGMFSIVPVSDDSAATWRIQGEPEKQPLSVFLKKITSLTRGAPRKPQSR